VNLNLLISVKPKYVKEILTGKKRYEFRKSIFKKPINKIYIYSTVPERKIVGYFDYKGYIKESPMILWEKTKEFSGINKDEYFDYFNKKENAYAIIIESFHIFDEPINPKDKIRNFVAPQSYKYINGDIF